MPPGTLPRVFLPVATLVLLLAVLVLTPEGGPIGGAWSWPCLLGAVLLALGAARWWTRRPAPRAVLDTLVVLPPILFGGIVVLLSLLLALR